MKLKIFFEKKCVYFNLDVDAPSNNTFYAVMNEIQRFRDSISTCWNSLWVVGYHTTNQLARKKFNFLKKSIELFGATSDIYLHKLRQLVSSSFRPAGPSDPRKYRDYIIDAKSLEFLEIEVIVTEEDRKHWEEKAKESTFVSKNPEIKKFFDYLKMLVNKLEELGKGTITENDLEFEEWFEVPASLSQMNN